MNSLGSSDDDGDQPAKKAKTAGGFAKRMKPASPPKARRARTGAARKYVEVNSSSESESGGSMFVDV